MNIDNEKNLELAGTILDTNDSETNETITGIIPQNIEEDNTTGACDPFESIDAENEIDKENVSTSQEELSIYQQSFLNTEVHLEKNKIYNAKYDETKISESGYMKYFNSQFTIFVDGKTKEVKITQFFNQNKSCVELSITRLKEMADQFGFNLSIQDCESLDTMAKAFERVKGTWVELRYIPRHDEENDKDYDNFEIVKVLGKDFSLGGNL